MAETAAKLGQVLMYKSGAKISEETLAELKAQGFIPIPVSDFDDLKLIDRAGGAVPMDLMLLHAVTAIAENDCSDDIRQSFLGGILGTLKRLVFVDKSKQS